MTWSYTSQPQPQHHFISCIRTVFQNGIEYMTHLVGSGRTWRHDEVISWLDSGLHRFFAADGVTTAEIKVFTSPNGNRYLKTVRDGRETNNLEALPRC